MCLHFRNSTENIKFVSQIILGSCCKLLCPNYARVDEAIAICPPAATPHCSLGTSAVAIAKAKQ
jgi:hypothetical protein